MKSSSQALRSAAGALLRISDAYPGERGHRASVVALVLNAIERLGSGFEGEFLARRAKREIDAIRSGAERSYLRRLLEMAQADAAAGIGSISSEYAGALEDARRLPEAEAVLSLARSLEPGRADIALRAGRLARLQGDHGRALQLYAVARSLDGGDGSIARLSAIGEAVADGSETALSRAIRAAVSAGDHEVAAVGLEERGRSRRSRGNRAGAARDFAVAAARYHDSVDRGRVAHLLADLYTAAGDAMAAREALLLALSDGDRSQRDHARARLHTLCRELGDEVGKRRWRSFDPPTLVSLAPRPKVTITRSAAPSVVRWRKRLRGFTRASGS